MHASSCKSGRCELEERGAGNWDVHVIQVLPEQSMSIDIEGERRAQCNWRSEIPPAACRFGDYPLSSQWIIREADMEGRAAHPVHAKGQQRGRQLL